MTLFQELDMSEERTFTHHTDMEPSDLNRKLNRPPSDEFNYEHKFLDVLDGTKIAYVDAGNPASDITVLFVHGAPESSYVWRNIMPYVERQARVIAPDHIGHGMSDKPDVRYGIEDYYKYLEAFLLKLDLKNIIIVCQDWGTVIGPLFGANHPERVVGVAMLEALLAPSYPMKNVEQLREDPTMAIAIDHYDKWRTQEAVKWNFEQNIFVERILQMHTIRKLSQRVMDHYRDPFRNPEARRPLIVWPRECGYDGDRPFPDEAMEKINTWLTTSDIKVLDFFAKPGAVTTQTDVAWRAKHIKNHESCYIGQGNHFSQEDCPESIGHGLGEWVRRNFAADSSDWYMTSPRNELEAVLHFFGAVIKGDIETALSIIHPECEWVYGGPDKIPFAGTFKGPQGVGEYLMKFNEACEIIDFKPEMCWDDDKIIMTAKEVNKGRASGKTITLNVSQVFKIRNGQIISFQEYADTATMATLFE
jgi:haloalkane dehalogenase